MAFWNFFRRYILNKYVVVCLGFAALMMFCGEQSLIHRMERAHQISELEDEIEMYEQKLEETQQRLDELDGNSENLEKYARERYLMHASGEDVYVFDE